MLRVWIMAWMLAIPLFHVHPEADHHHGAANHIHGGTVHTVFSPDLDDEFSHHQGETAAAEQPPANESILFEHPSHASDNGEVGFSFISDSTDRTLPKPLTTSALLVEPPAPTPLIANPSVVHPIPVTLPRTLLTHDIPSRAPPSVLV